MCMCVCMFMLDLFTLKNGQLLCPETLVKNYCDAIRNNPEELRSHLRVTTVSTKNSVPEFNSSLFFR